MIRPGIVCSVAAMVLMLAACAAPAFAQAPSVEFGVGGILSGAASAGETDASLLDPSGGSLALFRTTNRIAPGTGVEGLVSITLSERWRFEVNFGWVRTDFESRISGDFEGAAELSLTQAVNQYSADAALAVRVIQRRRWDMFLRGGAGGFREITTDRALVANGWRASAGGGANIWLRQAPPGSFGYVALRVEARVQARQRGIAFGDSGRRLSPVVFAGVVIGR